MPLKPAIKRRLRSVVGADAFIEGRAGLRVYECDGYTLEKATPELVLLPTSTRQISELVRVCNQEAVSFVARGAGTGVSGGCLPQNIPVMIATTRMRKIRNIDFDNRSIEVEAGVVNLEVTRSVEQQGYYYAPDPSSQSACTIGGNVAENSGGPHTLKYGVTLNHVLAIEMVLPNGEIVTLQRSAEATGYDLAGICIGSEGTLGIVTAATLRLLVKPQTVATLLAIFPDVMSASRAVSAIIAAGIIPAALEMMDALVIEAVEAAYGFGFPADAGAVLIIELDGLDAGIDELCERIRQACHQNAAREVRRAKDEQERALLWKSRKRAFGAMGRLAPAYCTQDGVVPRSRLPEIVEHIARIAERQQLRIANLMHAGDGNIHPLLLYDDSDEAEIRRVVRAGHEILEACVSMGGSVTGEHGIGIEKTGLMEASFSRVSLDAMRDLRSVFNPDGLCNPGKIFPTDRHCIEVSRPRPRGGG